MIEPESLLRQLWTVNHANVLLLGGVAFITFGLISAFRSVRLERTVCGLGCLVVLGLAAVTMAMTRRVAPGAEDLFVSDAVTLCGAKLAILGGVLLTLLGWDQIRAGRAANHYGCLLLMLSGLTYTASANDLVSLFLGLELVSICTTVLLSTSRNDNQGREATLKYFTLAAFASALFLLGASYLYGLSGSTALPAVYEALSDNTSVVARAALGLTLCGLCYRVTAVPFHFYAPDVFAGSAAHMAASMAVVPKVAGFVAIVRILGGAELNAALAGIAVPLLLTIAVSTMTLGNCAALVQTRLRRMLAYSSIAHSGYLLLAIAAVLTAGAAPTVVFDYLIVYIAMTLGMFAVVSGVERASDQTDQLSSFVGLYLRSPWLACGGAICLLSLTGLPLSAGFWAKLQVFLTSLAAERLDIRVAAVVMAINAAIAAAYYLSWLYRFFQPNTSTSATLSIPTTTRIACGLSTALTVLWFFFP